MLENALIAPFMSKTLLHTIVSISLLLPQSGFAQVFALVDTNAAQEGEETVSTETIAANTGIHAVAEAISDAPETDANGLIVYSALVAQLSGADEPKDQEDAALIIQQKSTSGRLGTWRLVTPNGEVKGTETDQTTGVYYSGDGTYNLYIQPPSNADTRVQIYEGTQLLSTGNGLHFSFSLNYTEQLRIIITYTFSGRVRVESSPNGAPFVLTGPNNMRITGTTPATFGNMPPSNYIVTFSNMDGCRTPKQIERSLYDTSVLTLNGVYVCGATSTSSASSSFASSVSSSSETTSSAMSVHSSNIVSHETSTEVLAGGKTHITIRIDNPLPGSIRNLTITEQFDPSILSEISDISGNGSIHGNLIIWEIPQIAAGKFWEGSYSARVDNRQGVQTTVTARVSGQYVENFDQDDLSDTAIIGVVVLPQTGYDADKVVLFVIAALAGLCTLALRKTQIVA